MNASTFKSITLILALVLLLPFEVAAVNDSQQTQPSFRQSSQERPKGGKGLQPSGPKQCTSQETCDAEGGCPVDAALGCSCVEIPQGTSACIPRCNTDADCPNPPGLALVCEESKNICVPKKRKGSGLNREPRQYSPRSEG